MGKVPWAPPPAGALLTSSQGDSSVLKLKAKLNQEHKPTTSTEANLSGWQRWWPGDECAKHVAHLSLCLRLSGGVAKSNSPIPTSRVRVTTQVSQSISTSVDSALQRSVAPTPRVN